jgi:hypothetical protein
MAVSDRMVHKTEAMQESRPRGERKPDMEKALIAAQLLNKNFTKYSRLLITSDGRTSGKCHDHIDTLFKTSRK